MLLIFVGFLHWFGDCLRLFLRVFFVFWDVCQFLLQFSDFFFEVVGVFLNLAIGFGFLPILFSFFLVPWKFMLIDIRVCAYFRILVMFFGLF